MFLTVILADTFSNRMALIHQNEFVPFKKRAVRIQLTEEQINKIKPQVIGKENGEEVKEEILECFLDYLVSIEDYKFDD